MDFPVVEVQQTFYQPPRDHTLRRWAASMPAGFAFTVKAWQLVTHPGTSPTYRRTIRGLDARELAGCGSFRDTKIVEEGFRRSVECARLLSATALLFQCPASFTPDSRNVERLRRFFTEGPGADRLEGVKFLWEPRGPKWVAERELARALSEELALVHVIDPFVTPFSSARGGVYWRLHGVGGARHSYTDAELERLRAMLEDAESRDPGGPSYVLFNNLPRIADARRFLASSGYAPGARRESAREI